MYMYTKPLLLHHQQYISLSYLSPYLSTSLSFNLSQNNNNSFKQSTLLNSKFLLVLLTCFQLFISSLCKYLEWSL